MHVRNTTTILVLAAVLLLAQTVSVVDAYHKSKNDPDPKKVTEAQVAADKKDKVEKNDEKRKAFNAYKDAFEAGVTESGVTIHYVDQGIDTGPQLFQEAFPRYEKDDFPTFKNRGMEVEYRLYRKAIDYIENLNRNEA